MPCSINSLCEGKRETEGQRKHVIYQVYPGSFHPRIYPSDSLQPLSHLGPVPSSWEFAVHRSGYRGLSLALCRYTVMASVQCPPDALPPPHPCMAYMEASLAVFPHLGLAQITLVRSPRLGLPQGVDFASTSQHWLRSGAHTCFPSASAITSCQLLITNSSPMLTRSHEN